MKVFLSVKVSRAMAAALLLFGTITIASSAPCDSNPSGDPYTINNRITDLDTLIIGSGWAGTGAAYEIERYNSHQLLGSNKISYAILEAAGFIGGRAVAAKWISGCEPNPIAELASKYFSSNKNSQDLPYLQYQAQDWEDIEYWCLKQNKPQYAKECDNQYVRKHTWKWWEVFECLEEKATNMDPNTDESVRETLASCGWENGKDYEADKGMLPNILEHYDIDMEFVQEPQYTSTREGFPLGPYDLFEEADCFISDPQFMARILREVVAKENIPVETNMKVCKVDWSHPDGNKVIACVGGDSTDCTEYTVPKVISTMSEGVMDAKGDDIFIPTITSQTNAAGTNKMQAMRNVFRSTYAHGAADPLVDDPVEGMTDYKEIRVQFDEKFWGDSQFIFIETEEPGQCNVWQSYETKWSKLRGGSSEFFPGSHMLVCVLTTEDYRAFKADTSRPTEEKVRELIQNSLGKVYGPGGPNQVDGWSEYVDDSAKACIRAPHPSSSDVYPFDFAHPPKPDVCKAKPNDSLCSAPYWDKEDPNRRCRFQMFDEESDNDLWHGSYVNWRPGGRKEDFDFFIEPLSVAAVNRTHFAGSATCYLHWAYTYGAWWSGLDASQNVIREIRTEYKGETDDFPPEFELSEHFCSADPPGVKG